jgi:hypothetical protein
MIPGLQSFAGLGIRIRIALITDPNFVQWARPFLAFAVMTEIEAPTV